MQDKLCVILEPSVPDHDVIVRHFFKTRKKGTQTFKSSKTIIHFHVPDEIHDVMLEKRDANAERYAVGRKQAGRKITAVRVEEIEPSMAADFMVGTLTCLQTIHF